MSDKPPICESCNEPEVFITGRFTGWAGWYCPRCEGVYRDVPAERPWRVGLGGETIYAADHSSVCDMVGFATHNGRANAALIVQAVNQHAALTAVAEAAKEDHALCEMNRRLGIHPHPCKVCDALGALAAKHTSVSQ